MSLTQLSNFERACFEDLIVNLIGGYYPMEKAAHLYRTLIRTESGKKLFKTVFMIRNDKSFNFIYWGNNFTQCNNRYKVSINLDNIFAQK
ncbi:hypothetical protein MASR1M31_10430 [Porphyromonadaceae bacterium]